jgi:hypothetical protein
MEGDTALSLLGWMFFRNAEWAFPVGYLPNMLYPIGVNLGFTDAIPWAAVLSKLGSAYLPEVFQYNGLWILLCISLQGLFAYLLLTRLLPSKYLAVLGACLLCTSPAWYFRLMHLALFSHWVILCSFWLYVKRSKHQAERLSWWPWIVLNIVSAGIHPYLAVMVFALSCAEPLSQRFSLRAISNLTFFIKILSHFLGSFITFYGFGYIQKGQPIKESAFGEYSSNLNSLFTTLGYREFWGPFLKSGKGGQYEGFAYLGAGVLCLLALALVLLVWRREDFIMILKKQRGRFLSFLIVILLLAFYGYSPKFYWGDTSLFGLTTIYNKLFRTIVDSFRVSGRFIWPMHYFVILGSILVVSRFIKKPLVVGIILLLTLSVQTLEIRNFIPHARAYNPVFNPLQAKEWDSILLEFKHIQLFPPHTPMIEEQCASHDNSINYYLPFVLYAAKNNLTINSAYVARPKKKAIIDQCEKQLDEFKHGIIDPDSLVVVDKDYISRFQEWMGDKVHCKLLDDYHVCVNSTHHVNF